MKKYIKKGLVLLLAGLIIFNAFSSISVYAEEMMNQSLVQTQQESDTETNNEEAENKDVQTQETNEQQENKEADKQESEETENKEADKQESEEIENKEIQQEEQKEESVKIQSDDEGTEFIKALLRDDGDTLLETSKRMVMYAGVQLSGNDTQLNDAYMLVSFPSANISSVKASTGAALPKDPTIEKDSNNYTIRYDYPNLSGGMKIELPIIFNMISFNNYSTYIEIPVTATLYDTDGNVQDEKSLLFKSERRFSVGYSWSQTTSYSYKEKYRDDDYTSTNPDELTFQNYSFYYSVSGNTLPDSVKVTATLEEGVIFDAEKNKDYGWTYDDDTRTLTKTNTSPKYDNTEYNYIYLKFSHWKYGNQMKSVTFKAVSLFGGNEVANYTKTCYQTVYKNSKIGANRYLYMKDVGLALEKTGDFKNLTYKQKDNYIAQRDSYKNKNIYTKMNVNDGSISLDRTPTDVDGDVTVTSDFYINQLVFGKDSIDLNFSKFYVDSSKITNDEIRENFKKNNILYGIKEDNTKVEIARNIEMDQEVDIPAQTKETKYKTLQLEFPDGFNLVRKYANKAWDDRINFDVYVGVKFFEDDWNQATYSYKESNRFLSQKVLYSRTQGESNSQQNNDSYYSNRQYYYPFSSVGLVPESQRVYCMYGSWSDSAIPEGAHRYLTMYVRVDRPTGFDYSEDEKKHIKNGKMWYIIPKGYEQSPNHKTYLEYYDTEKEENVELEVTAKKIDNWQGSDTTAYVIDLPKIDNCDDGKNITFNFPIRPNADATPGTMDIDIYFSWKNNGDNELPGGQATDVYDMNEDGSREDKIYKYYTYRPTFDYSQSVYLHPSTTSHTLTPQAYKYITPSISVSRPHKEDITLRYLKNGKMYFVVPNDYEYASDQKTYIQYYDTEEKAYKDLEIKPEEISDFQGTGKKAYVMALPDKETLKNMDDEQRIYFYFPVIATQAAKYKVSSSIQTYFSWENNARYEIYANRDSTYYSQYNYSSSYYSNIIADAYDLNGNGSRTDNILSTSYSLNFVPDQYVQLDGSDMYRLTDRYTAKGGYTYFYPSIRMIRNNPVEKKYIKNGKMYFVLPEGYEHAKEVKTYIQYYDTSSKQNEKLDTKVETIENFKDTGKTAYVMSLPDLSKIENCSDVNNIYFYFPVRPTQENESPNKRSTINVYFSWENNSEHEIYAQEYYSSGSYYNYRYSYFYTDAYDLNSNGDTSDQLLYRYDYVNWKYDQRVLLWGSSYTTYLGKLHRIEAEMRVDRDLTTVEKRYFKNGKMYFVMPKGYEYKKGERAYIRYYNPNLSGSNKYVECDTTVETIANFKDTGQTAYVMSLPDRSKMENWNDQTYFYFNLPIYTKTGKVDLNSKVNVYFSWENNAKEEIEGNLGNTKDIYDLNENGSVEDTILKTDINLNLSYDQSVSSGWYSGSSTSIMLGEYATISPYIRVNRATSGVENRRIKNGKMYYVVPEGYEYAKGEKTAFRYYDSAESKTKEVEVTPKAIYNFKNTGKTAYVLSIPELENWNDQTYTYFDLPVRPTANAPQGQSTIDIYFAWDNNENLGVYASGSNAVEDTYDLNGNGSTEDKIFKSTYTINYVSTIEVAGVHRVGNTLDGLNSSGSTIDLGSEFYYGMDILNLQNDTSVKSLSIMEILPYKNDKSIIPDKTGTYTERESQYRVHINGPVQVLKDGQVIDADEAGYEVVYSTETPESEGFSNNLNKTFTKTVDDWTKVTMFKITMKQGTEIAEKGSMRFVVKALVPENDAINDDDIAKASFAYVSSSAAGANFRPANYIETTSIATPVARYQISGNVYMDYNINGSHDSNEMVFDGLKVGLYDENDTEVAQTKTDTDGNYVFDFLKRGNYKVKLKEKPNGTEYPDEANHYDDIFPVAPQTRAATTGKNSLDKTGSSEVLTMDPDTKKRSLEMGLEAQLQEISVEKQWLGPEGSNTVDVTLHGLDQEKQMTLTSDNGWTDRFVHLRKIDENGKAISYTLTEDTDIDGYIKKVEKNDQGFTVQNINTEKVNVPVEVRWIGKESKDTDITLVETKTKQTVTADDKWKYDFTDLYKYDQENGNEINYTIKAKDIEGYTKEITGDMKNGYVVTYTNVEKIKIPVTIKWIGKEGQEAEVTLVQENNKQTINADDNWKYSFKDLFKYDQTTGEEINYTIEAKDVEGYAKEITGDMTNGFVVIYRDQEKRNVSVSKQWVGEEKENVTVRLFKDRNEEEKMTLDSTNNWQGEFKDLYKYNQEDGHVIEYTIEEDEVKGYKTGISGNMDLGYTITNTITGRISIPVTKEFIGPQTENVTVDLYANDVKVDSIELNDTNHWQYTFTDKEKYEDGKEIVYTIKEHEIDNYKSKITGNALDGYVITNTNVEKIKIPVTIKWIGKEGQETDVTLNEEKDKQNITADNDWKYSFKDLYKYDQETGEEINYTITAKDIEGYTKEITGDKENGYIVTYKQIISKIEGNEKIEPTSKEQGIIEKILGPKTGDKIMMSGFIILLLASIGGILLIKRKKKD